MILWKLLITKNFFNQYLNLSTDKQRNVLDSIRLLRDILDVDKPLTLSMVDEYSKEASEPAEPFPITYHVDYVEQELYLISIEESFRSPEKIENQK